MKTLFLVDTGWMETRHILTLCTFFFSLVDGFIDCPRQCFCNDVNQIVYCSRRGLQTIPDDMPRDAKQINVNGNVFRNSRLERANFTGFTYLEHLYLSECGIEALDVETFMDLTQLKWLDLSNNRIRLIQDYTFRGSHLDHLFLNGNRNLQFKSHSFSGLETTGLYLHDCSLKKLNADVLEPLNSTLRKLWLDGNELEIVDRRFIYLFSTLVHLRLGSNPLHCNCEVVWLKEFYDKNVDTFKGAPPPSCLTPQKLKGKYYNALSLFDFRCQPPVFNNIDALFDNNMGRLRCTATGDPAPTLYWIRPTGESRRYSPPADEEARLNEGVLSISVDDNVTLTLNVSWPHAKGPGLPQVTPYTPWHYPTRHPSAERHPSPSTIRTPDSLSSSSSIQKPSSGKTSRSHPEVSNPNKDSSDQTLKSNQYNLTEVNMLNFKRRSGEHLFNVTELVGAVIGTFVCTLLLCLILMPIYLRRQWKRKLSHPGFEKTTNPESLYLNGLTQADYFDTPHLKR